MLRACCSSGATSGSRSPSKAPSNSKSWRTCTREGFAAGELKHGRSRCWRRIPVVVVVPSPRGRGLLHEKIVSNIQEVRARGAKTMLVIAEEGTNLLPMPITSFASRPAPH